MNWLEGLLGLALGIGGIVIAVRAKRQLRRRNAVLEREWSGTGGDR